MKNLFPYIYDFVSIVFENTEIRKYLRNIILFGSVATGDYDKESDIDLFINVNSDDLIEPVERIFRDSEKRFYTVIDKKWALLGIETPIKYIVGNLESYRWKEIKSEIISTGINLYGKYEGVKKDLKAFSLFNFELSKLKHNKRMQLRRKLFGYSIKQGKKVYKRPGYLKEIGGIKIGKNSILVPLEKSRDVQKLLNSFRVTPEIREVWIKD